MRENIGIDLSELLNQPLNTDELNLLISEGRIKFPERKVTAPSAISKGTAMGECQIGVDGVDTTRFDNKQDAINEIVHNVKENEDLVKMLEDMRDDLLKDMKIPPASDQIKEAAKFLGSKDGTIDKNIFDKAKTITKLVPLFPMGVDPRLAALLGDGRIKGPYKNCAEITRAVFDGIELVKDPDTKNFDENFYGFKPGETTDQTIAKSDQAFADQMKQMFAQLINKLFWDFIWTRMWVGIFDMVEKMIAKPIDVPILILKSLLKRGPQYKLSTENFYKYGPVHKLLSKMIILFLCKIPRKHYDEYKPEPELQVYVNGKGLVYLASICTAAADECPGILENNDDDQGGSEKGVEEVGDLDQVGAAVENAFGQDDCPKTNLGSSLGKLDKGKDSLAVNPDCLDAAKKVLQAVYNDALYNHKSD